MDDEYAHPSQIMDALDAIDTSNPEDAHREADAILLRAMPEDIRDAYRRVETRYGWSTGG